MAKRKKIQKKKKVEIQDFITKIKELRKVTEDITSIQLAESVEFPHPSQFEWRGESFKVQTIIGRWIVDDAGNISKFDKDADTQDNPRNCFRAELENGFQVDIAHLIKESRWLLTGVEPELYEKMRKS